VKAFKCRIYPTRKQHDLLQRTFGCCRYVWNALLAECQAQYALYKETQDPKDRPKLGFNALNQRLTQLKRDPARVWLNEVPAVALQQTALDLAKAFQSAFTVKGRGFPKFKSKHSYRQSFRVVGKTSIHLKDCKLRLPKADSATYVAWTRGLPCEPTSYTVVQNPDGKYHVSFLCREYDPKLTNGTGVIGLDLGIKDFIVDSNGVRYDNPKHLAKSAARLAKYQRRFARRKKGSARREKARKQVARTYAKITNQRKDYHHKLSRIIVNENQVIGLEDLNVKGMVRNRKIAKSVSDVGFSQFRDFVTYKALESGHVQLVVLDRWYPSTQLCSACGHRLEGDAKLTLKTRAWTCPKCGTLHDRDENAARNIRDVAASVVQSVGAVGAAVHLQPALQDVRSLLNKAPAAPGSAQLTSCL
jgi:putative transposase